MHYALRLLLVACLVLTAGCGPEITKRYSQLVPEDEHQYLNFNPQVEVTTFVSKASGSAAPAVLQLSDQGQAALINAFAKNGTSVDSLLADLKKEMGSSSPEGGGRTSKTVRVVYSVSSELHKKARADRINELKIVLTGLSKEMRFAKWNRFESEYGIMDLGKLSLTRSMGANVGIEPTLAGSIVGKASGGANVSQSMLEELSLSRRFLVTSGILQSNQATILHEGAPHIDLKGNYSFDLTLAFADTEPIEVVSFEKSFWEDDKSTGQRKPMPQEKLAYRMVKIAVPTHAVVKGLVDADGVKCCISGKFEVRHVVAHEDTNHEGDDRVAFVSGDLQFVPQKELTLMGAAEVQRMGATYYIYEVVIKPNATGKRKLSIKHYFGESPDGKQFYTMQFSSYAKAQAFLDWLQATKSAKVFGQDLALGQKTLAKKKVDYNRLMVGAEIYESPKVQGKANQESPCK